MPTEELEDFDGEYLYTTIDYGPFAHDPWENEVTINMQMDYAEVVTGRSIEVYDEGPPLYTEQEQMRGGA